MREREKNVNSKNIIKKKLKKIKNRNLQKLVLFLLFISKRFNQTMDNQLLSSDDIDMSTEKEIKEEGGVMNEETDGEEDEEEHLEDDYVLETDTKTPGEILDDFCSELKDINTTLPDSVINHYMRKSGFVVNDNKLVKIISIASQKFISEIVNDVMQHHRLKTKSTNLLNANAAANAAGSGNAANPSSGPQQQAAGSQQQAGAKSSAKSAGANPPAPSLTLTLEDLSQVLTEYGINVKKPYYFM
jgi:transcription initiation factor TFIID subunit 10